MSCFLMHTLVLASAISTTPCRHDTVDTRVSPRAPSLSSSSREKEPLGVFAHVSSRVLNHLIQREVHRHEKVAESILNLSTQGTTHADCRIGLELVPSPDRGIVRFLMKGQAKMDDTLGTTRSITVHSSSKTQISGQKDLFLDAGGLRTSPAKAVCRTSLQVKQVNARRRFVERIARRRIDQMQPQAEQIASERAARRVERQMNTELDSPLKQLQRKYLDNVYLPLIREDTFPKMRLATTREHLSVSLPCSRVARSAVPQPAYDVAFCIRDDAVNELAETFLNGRTLQDRQFAELLQTLTGSTPRPLWIHDRSERWSVTAASASPLQVIFKDDKIHVDFIIERATRDDQQIDVPLAVSVAYGLEITRDGPRLVRSGDLAVNFTGISTRASATEPYEEFRQFLHRKFEGVFPAELSFDGLVAPAGGFWGRLRELRLSQLTSRQGWLAIGYDWMSEAPSTRVAVK